MWGTTNNILSDASSGASGVRQNFNNNAPGRMTVLYAPDYLRPFTAKGNIPPSLAPTTIPSAKSKYSTHARLMAARLSKQTQGDPNKEIQRHLAAFPKVFDKFNNTGKNYESWKQLAEQKKEKHPDILKGVPTPALVAVMGYTLCDHSILNHALGTGNEEELAKLEPYIALINHALDKLPSTDGPITLYRSANKFDAEIIEDGETFAEGNEFTNPCFVSTSINKVKLTDRKYRIVYEAFSAKDISFLSEFPEEKEYLLGTYRRCKIGQWKDVKKFDDCAEKEIYMKEIQLT